MKLIATNCALLVVVSVSVIMRPDSASAAAAEETKEVTKKVVFERVNFESDPEFVVSEQEITVVDGLTTANIQVNVKKTLPKDHLLFLELSSEKEGEFKSLIKTGEVVGCDLLKNATGQPLLKPVLSLLEKFSNLPLQCPLPVGEFWLKAFTIESSMIPSFIPEGRYKFLLYIKLPQSGKLVYKTEWLFSLTKN